MYLKNLNESKKDYKLFRKIFFKNSKYSLIGEIFLIISLTLLILSLILILLTNYLPLFSNNILTLLYISLTSMFISFLLVLIFTFLSNIKTKDNEDIKKIFDEFSKLGFLEQVDSRHFVLKKNKISYDISSKELHLVVFTKNTLNQNDLIEAYDLTLKNKPIMLDEFIFPQKINLDTINKTSTNTYYLTFEVDMNSIDLSLARDEDNNYILINKLHLK